MAPRITVVGGANIDIAGIPAGRFVLRDSNPGHVRESPGGVGRNIAENLARLGAEVRLVTSFGTDSAGDDLAADCERAGIDTTYSIRAEGIPGSRYLAVLDDSGDLAAAVNDMRALDALTPDVLDPGAFSEADVVVLDTNLHGSTLARAAEFADGIPIVLDPVSTAKAPLALPILGRLAAIKANLREAEEISGAAGAEGAATRLLEAGVRAAFITMGAGGVLYAAPGVFETLSVRPVRVVNATGAGDAFAAGVAWGIATGLGLGPAARFAAALSRITLESERTVSERVSLDLAESYTKEADG